MVAAAGVYDCESVTSSARDKTHEGVLPVIRPDRSKWGVSPCFAGCTPTAHRHDRRFPLHSVCIQMIAPSYELRAGGLVGLRPKSSLDIARQHKVMTLLSAAVVLLTQGPPCETPLEALRLQNPGGQAASAVGRNTPTPDKCPHRGLRRSKAKRQPLGLRPAITG